MAKILFLVTEDWYFWSHRVSLARTAKARGHEVVVATRVKDHGELIRSQGFTLLPIGLRRRSASPLAELASIWELVRIYRRERPDLVHHVAIKPILYGSLAAVVARVGAVVNAITGLGYVFINKGWKASIVRFLVKSGYRLAFSLPNCRVIFQNPQDMELFVTEGMVQPAKAALIRGSGVDTRLFSPVSAAPGSGATCLGLTHFGGRSRAVSPDGTGEPQDCGGGICRGESNRGHLITLS